jgi:hypothetical protein
MSSANIPKNDADHNLIPNIYKSIPVIFSMAISFLISSSESNITNVKPAFSQYFTASEWVNWKYPCRFTQIVI